MRQCRNFELQLDDPFGSPEAYCAACRHNRTIPDLSVPQNLTRFGSLESAKRRMFYSLLRLHLPLANRVDDPARGLAFDFVAADPAAGTTEVITGHEDGLITINLREADDAEREKMRNSMAETYRTLLGHFRHEIGHYYWDRLVRDGDSLEKFRELFGDERQDYDEALKLHYANGHNGAWRDRYISHYAASHPWEDFAETWAHYLHIVDTLEMACAFGVRVEAPVGTGVKANSPVDALIQQWLPLAIAVNGMNRCMGEPDLYPFVLTPAVIGKIGFIHQLVESLPAAE